MNLLHNISDHLFPVLCALALALAAVSVATSSAGAAPSEPGDPRYCFRSGPLGIKVIYEPWTVVAVTDEDGNTRRFRCNGQTGEWEEITWLAPSGAMTFPIRIVGGRN
jgi:hypothetical protein